MAIKMIKKEGDRPQPLPATVWQGAFFSAHSLSRVNRELVSALLRLDPLWSLNLLATEWGEPIEEAGSHPLQFYNLLQARCLNKGGWQLAVRHQFPPDWTNLPIPVVVIQPWELTSAPRLWVEQFNQSNRTLWVPSQFVYRSFADSGVPESRIRLIPNGVNIQQFNPQSPPVSLNQLGMTNVPRESLKDRYKFLYVGGSIQRKGIDVLLKAYKEAFKPQEDVLLVVKDFGTRDIYSLQNWRAELEQWVSESGAPPLLYIPDTLPEREMPGLYTACDALVHPYRGEGFGLPVAEALACGLPVIVTGFGACLDFCDEQNAYLLASSMSRVSGDLGEMTTVATPYWAEPAADDLIDKMRQVYEHREEAAQKAQAGCERISSHFTWDHAAVRAAVALREAVQESRERAHYSHFARARLEQNDPVAALHLFAQAAELEPNNPRIYEGAIIAALQQNQWEEATRLLHTSLEMFPHEPGLRAQKSWIAFYSQREEEVYPEVVRLLREGYSDDNWLHQVVLPLRDYLICQLPKEQGTRDQDRRGRGKGLEAKGSRRRAKGERKAQAVQERIEFIEKRLRECGIVIPNERVGRRITLCMIAKNEADFLADCLKSAKDVVDEIVLVDTGSTDETPEIARRFGAKVVEHPWNDDFSEARNVGLAHATGDWILWLDADERLTPQARELVLEAVRHPQFAAYYVEILNVLNQAKPDDVFIHRAVRLFRHLSFTKWEGRVHEQVMAGFQVRGYRVANLQNAQIIHLGYERSLMTERNKTGRNVRILEKSLEENPNDSFHLFNLANTYFENGEYEQALPYLQKACEEIESYQDFAPVAWSQWITCLYNLGQVEKARSISRTALARGIRHPLVYFAYAETCNLVGEYETALESLDSAKQMAIQSGLLSADGTTLLRSSGFVGDPNIVTYKWYYARSRAYLGLGQLAEARQLAEQALGINPTYSEAHYLMAELLRLDGQIEAADVHYRQAFQSVKVAPYALQDVAVMWWEMQQWHRALPYLGQLAELRPQEEVWWHRWMYCAEQTGNRRAICQAFEFLVRHEKPLSANIHVNWGRALWDMGDYENALYHFTQGVEMEPQNANVLFNAGDALYRLGSYSEAAEIYSAALARDPYNPEGWFVLGNCYFRMDVYDAALIAYRQALQLNPHHGPAQQNLAITEEMIRTVAA